MEVGILLLLWKRMKLHMYKKIFVNINLFYSLIHSTVHQSLDSAKTFLSYEQRLKIFTSSFSEAEKLHNQYIYLHTVRLGLISKTGQRGRSYVSCICHARLWCAYQRCHLRTKKE